jgi:hypothetical protein
VLVPYFCCKSFRPGASTVRRPLDLPRARAVAKVPRSARPKAPIANLGKTWMLKMTVRFFVK